MVIEIAIAFILSLGWCVAASKFGSSFGFVDLPDDVGLKTHDSPAVPLGGVGVFLGVHAGLAASGMFDVGLLLAGALVLMLGLFDDRSGLSPGRRLVVQILAALVLVASAQTPLDGRSVTDLLVGVALVVVAINAVNLFDGLDGLVGASAIVAALGSAVLDLSRGGDGAFGLILAASLAGFIGLNWHRARVFLGDNGAYVVGLFLAHAVLRASPDGPGPGFAVALVLLGVFLLDLGATVLRRRIAGRRMFAGDRSHLYDQVNDRGVSVPRVALTFAAGEAAFVALALSLNALDIGSEVWLLLGGVGVAVLVALGAGGFLTSPHD